MTHRGVALDEPRNRAVLEFLKPPEVTAALVAERLVRAHGGSPPPDLADKVAWVLSRPRQEPIPSQPLEAVGNPLYGLGTHPDLVERLWRLNAALPADCRWVVYRCPALVHPQSGIVFGFGFGTIGYALDVPEDCRAEAERRGLRNRRELPRSQPYDLGPLGAGWRFGKWREQETGWCRAAYDVAGVPAG